MKPGKVSSASERRPRRARREGPPRSAGRRESRHDPRPDSRKQARAPAGPERLLWPALAAYAAALSWIVLAIHSTPLFGVETDLLGTYIPAARAILEGRATADHFQFHGPGYPLLLAAAGAATGGDQFLGARIVNVLAAVGGVWASFLLFGRILGPGVGLFVLIGLCVNPVFLRAAIECSTDLPAFALFLVSTHLVLCGRTIPDRVGAGFAAGYAIITRYNAVFLPLAALLVLLFRERGWRAVFAYSLGLVVPVGGWLLWNHALTGSPFTNLNHLNLAYAFYGQGRAWDEFWAVSATRFQSLWDVISHDPALVLRTVVSHVPDHWGKDLTVLVPLWIGVFSVPGMVLAWPAHRGWPGLWLHYASCFLVLCTVFYAPRFFLYLAPFYLAGAGSLLLAWQGPARVAWLSRELALLRRRAGWLPVTAAAALLGLSARDAFLKCAPLLENAPHEVRVAGQYLRAIGRPGDRLMARKPHVAYFADMDFAPMPFADSPADLVASARRAGVGYLYVSGIEAQLRNKFVALADGGVRLPGLHQIYAQDFDRDSYFAIYRVTDEPFTRESFDRALIETQFRFVRKYPADAVAWGVLGELLLEQHRPADALEHLEAAARRFPGNLAILQHKAEAHFLLGQHAQAEAASRAALAVIGRAPRPHELLGRIHLARGELEEAQRWLLQAATLDPANARTLQLLGGVHARLGRHEKALEYYRKALRMTPDATALLLDAARALALSGQPGAAVSLLDESAGATGPELAALAESLRVAMRR